MRLWTYQGVEHSLTDGQVDLSRLPYSETVRGYDELRKRLANLVGCPSGQFIWCLTRDSVWGESEPLEKYTLDVPQSDFLAVIDGPVWERILETGSVPDSLIERYRNEWKVGDVLELKIAEYHAQQPPTSSWWDSLLLDQPDAESTVLLKHPVPAEWIISRKRYESSSHKKRMRAMQKSSGSQVST